MTKNFDRLHAELDFLRQHPLAHQQADWITGAPRSALEDPEVAACGTVGCLAGWAVIHEYDLTYYTYTSGERGPTYWFYPRLVYRRSGEPYTGVLVPDACEIFGLTDDEAGRLFLGVHTIDDLERIVKDWENEA